MGIGLSDTVRRVAASKYVQPKRQNGQQIRIRLGDIQKDLLKEGFPQNHIRQIRTSLEAKPFWDAQGLRLDTPKGQPDLVDTELVFTVLPKSSKVATVADPLLELRGVLRGAIREGAAAFLKELRKDKRKDSEAA